MEDDKTPDVGADILSKLRIPSMHPRQDRPMEPLGEPVDPALLAIDFAKCEVMVDTNEDKPEKGLTVFRATGRDIPNLVRELGRLREETFRTVGEGSGLAYDNDAFDEYYDHFVGYDKARKEITGAYRLGHVDKILKERGPDGVYTNTLFHLESLFTSDFAEGTLEAGRSFVKPDYQRGLSLLIIWMALARYIIRNPRYKYLIGPVSISNDFHENSKHLMVNYLMKNHPHEKSDLVQPKIAPKFGSNLSPDELTAIVDASFNLKSLQEFVRQAEGNPRAQVPQLIKLYLELGVRFLAFNHDPDFNSIDGLIWLDIPAIPADIVTRYFGEEGWASYSGHHR